MLLNLVIYLYIITHVYVDCRPKPHCQILCSFCSTW